MFVFCFVNLDSSGCLLIVARVHRNLTRDKTSPAVFPSTSLLLNFNVNSVF